ncbi:hypothetical protein D3C87_1534780 [compost metagenome]
MLDGLPPAHDKKTPVDDRRRRAIARGGRIGNGRPAPGGGVEHQGLRGVHVIVEMARVFVGTDASAHQIKPLCDRREYAFRRGIGNIHAVTPAIATRVVDVGRGLGAPVRKAATEAARAVDQAARGGKRDVMARFRQGRQPRPSIGCRVIGFEVRGVAGVGRQQPAGNIDAAVEHLGIEFLAGK